MAHNDKDAKGRSPLFLIWTTVFIDLVGFGIIIPILPLYAERHGATPLDVGLLLASYSAMQFVFAPVLGSLSDRVGRKPVLAVSLYGTALASLALGAASAIPNSLWLIFLARLLDGVTGANIATAQAYVADVTTEEKRARGLGLIGMAFGLGFVLGPAIGGLLASIDVSLPFYVVGGLAALNATLMLFRLPEPERHIAFATEARSRLSRVAAALRDPRTRLLLVVVLLATTAFAAMEATLALLLKDRFSYDEAHAAWLFAFVGVVMAVVQGGLVGRLVERVGERPLVVAGTALLATALALIGLPLPASLGVLLAALALLAIGSGLQTPATTALVSRLTPAAQQGSALGVSQSMSALGRIAGPLLGGALYHFGWATPYYAGSAIMTAALAVAIYYNATVEPLPATGNR
jgi:DHA1 family tetracycline resistance protein-like MFS transporter